MRDATTPDEEWAQRLRGRVDDVVPTVPVDVGAAIRTGRRRRAARRLSTAGVTAAVVAGVVLAVPAVGALLDQEDGAPVLGEEAHDGVARVLEDGPDCFAEDVLRQLGIDPHSRERLQATGLMTVLHEHGVGPAATPGELPAGFEPVAVVECRVAPDEPLSAVVPVVYEQVTLGPSFARRAVAGTTDVVAFIEALQLPSETYEEMAERMAGLGSVGCELLPWYAPAVFLVDADGRAVRPVWPTDGCGFSVPGIREAYAALEPVGAVRYEGRFDTYTTLQLREAAARLQPLLDERGVAWSWVGPSDDLDALVVSGPLTAVDTEAQEEVRALVAQRIGPVPVEFAADEPERAATARPFDPDVRTGTVPMRIEPSVLRSGPAREVRVTYPDGTPRGIAYVLEHGWPGLTEPVWKLRFFLVAGLDGRPGDWWPAEGDATPDGGARGWADIGIEGEGPDVLTVPSDLEPGTWRLCTANAPQNVCEYLHVDEP